MRSLTVFVVIVLVCVGAEESKKEELEKVHAGKFFSISKADSYGSLSGFCPHHRIGGCGIACIGVGSRLCSTKQNCCFNDNQCASDEKCCPPYCGCHKSCVKTQEKKAD
jgi:hypothetical protein